jgi:hypothetical protein
LTVTVEGFTGVLCLVDGVEIAPVSGNAGRFVIRAAELAGGLHLLTVIGINGGKARSAELPFTVIPAPGSGGNGAAESPVIEADSAEALLAALDALGENTAATPYAVKLSGFKINNNTTSGNTLRTLYDALNRYVTLDLRDCTGTIYSTSNSSGKGFIVGVRLGQNVTTIDTNAFSACTALVYAGFPNVTLIKSGALASCTALEAITLGSSPPELGSNALPSGHPFAAIFVPNGAAGIYQNTGATGWTPELEEMVLETSSE